MNKHTTQNPSKPRQVLLLAAALLALITVAWLGLRLYRVWRAAVALRADARVVLALAEGDPADLDPHEAASLLSATRADLLALDAAARPFLSIAPHLRWIPRWGPTIKAAPLLLDMALDLTAAGEQVIDVLLPILEADGAAGPRAGESLIGGALATLTQARPQLDEALSAVQAARAARARVDAQALVPQLHGWIARLDRYLPLLEQGLRVLRLAPDALGADEPRTYLLLVQNEDELRATGGFISGVARLTLADGEIQSLRFEDSYAVDDFSHPYPEPPAALRETMSADLWLFRDSNWTPHFPTAAGQAMELYRISRDVAIDGVVALDQRAISLLLDPLAPLAVEGVDEPVTGQNILRIARESWAPGDDVDADWWVQRKDIMGSVLDAAVRHLEGDLDRNQLLALPRAATDALRQKHILIYLRDPAIAAALRDLGWDGALAARPGDFLMAVDTNVGFNKANALVARRLDYAVDLTDPTRPAAALTVHHRHPLADWDGPCSQRPRYSPTYEGMAERCYYNYLRVYAPAGAQLLDATPHAVPGSILLSGERRPPTVDVSVGETDKVVFSTLFVVRPGESLQTTFRYELPQAVLHRADGASRYRLTIQKQPGTDAVPLELTLRLPPDAHVLEAHPAPTDQRAGTLSYRLDLRTDLALHVVWKE